ncbi:ATP-binding cassette domain-containing protein [Celerinatantimonas sp. MCCC 1A17872]|uniref:ATP-binding cassette domain-containing protein n=1 Tax=Celerinatantimonas sp. MCCC 1A17872 TaxID=3177514 RepID=UPI0038C9726E
MITAVLEKQVGVTHISAKMSLNERSITALSGHSGAGKTSIMNMLAGLITPDAGHIHMHQQILFDANQQVNLPPEKRQVGYIFQDKRLFNFMSVKRNLLFSGKTALASERFNQVVELLALAPLLKRSPTSLSGGEAQRVAIGRALLSKPKLLLLDEPMSFLDAKRKVLLMGYLKKLPEQFDMSLLLVSHNNDEIEQLADKTYQIENGQVSLAQEYS